MSEEGKRNLGPSGKIDPSEAPVKVLEHRLSYQGKILKIYDDLVEVNGRHTHWDLVHHNGAAAVLPVTDDGKILMVRQYRHALSRYTLEIPAGKLDSPDEPMIECARRELEEETGYRSDDLSLLLNINTTVAFCDEFIGVFLAKDLKKSHQHLDEDEDINVEAWELKDLLELIYTQKMTDSKTVAAILAYANKIGEKL
ncbi:MAG TPA: NUDIX hydrolase [Candidatus Avilachnospira avicola]|nr:NUDIX hydrolase [Candidatus Avilachnospira avicola]